MKKASIRITTFCCVVGMFGAFTGCNAETERIADSIASVNSVDSEIQAEPEMPDAETSKNFGDTITVTDHAGNVIEVPAEIDRIIVGDILPLASVLTVFFDNGDKIVGMAEGSMKAAENGLLGELYPEVLNAETDFIDGTSINIEEVVALEPDIFFYSANSPQIGEQLTQAGIPAIAISVNKWEYNTIETLNNWIDLLSQIFPENDKANTCREYSNEVYSMVQERVETIPEEEREQAFFLFQYSDSNITTSGKLFFGQFWADAMGAKNVGEELKTDNSIAVSMEQIYEWNPSLIFITNFTSAYPEDLYNNTIGEYDWSAIDAVTNQRVYKMPLGMYRSYTPGIDTPITLLWFAKTAYPDLFEDIDITQETKKYYQEIFDISLTDEQAESIFAPVSASSAY
ncbi:MAG: ABC transporter substrate-binding protein [Oscillospiraceae bacterium]|nr:ABC transporter substrate-binding protein [Oscillospiraceae bacterium]